jgi:phosphatidylglycerol:prolipoprotein diacylglycerol transferase
MMALAFPAIDPVAIQLGPLQIHWYGVAYVAGIALGWWAAIRLAAHAPQVASRQQLDDFVTWATIGILVGGRLFHVLVYAPSHYLANPLRIFAIWEGGMAFHGGMLGVIVAGLLFVRRHAIAPLAFGDIVATVAPIGIFFGRLANFVNQELWGHPTDAPWAMIFPRDPQQLPRHPSQLYEAALEGALLFAILALLAWFTPIRRRPGILLGGFLVGYAIARSICEFFRLPDGWFGPLTTGQAWSLPMLIAGAVLIALALRRPPLGART